MSTLVRPVNFTEMCAGVWIVNGPAIAHVSEGRINIEDAGAVLLPASDIVCSNGRVHD